ncbi:EboA domain-containing protein [Nocardia sp. NPDC004722]
MKFHLGYGTNGFSNHRLEDALAVIADLGYRAVALTLDHAHLDPFSDDIVAGTARVAARLEALGLRVVVETGARYLLDPYRKHHPTLVSEGREVRIDFLVRAAQIAADLGADCVSFWSGISPPTSDPAAVWNRLQSGVAAVLDRTPGVPLALEPEPGMVVARLDQALQLRSDLGAPELLGVTLDVGHCVAVEPRPVADCVRRVGHLLMNVQLDDMLPGVHEHLEFGAGELDLPATLRALTEIGYTGVAAVELPRHAHAAPEVARRALEALHAAADPWLRRAELSVRTDPSSIHDLFAMAGREAGAAGPNRARQRLLRAYAESAQNPSEGFVALYWHGTSTERRAVLDGLADIGDQLADTGVELVKDALRSNDTGVIAAAMGSFAAMRLDQPSWRHGVLKCLFMGIPLDTIADLGDRIDATLLGMVSAFAEERRLAGRPVPDDAVQLLEVTP